MAVALICFGKQAALKAAPQLKFAIPAAFTKVEVSLNPKVQEEWERLVELEIFLKLKESFC